MQGRVPVLLHVVNTPLRPQGVLGDAVIECRQARTELELERDAQEDARDEVVLDSSSSGTTTRDESRGGHADSVSRHGGPPCLDSTTSLPVDRERNE